MAITDLRQTHTNRIFMTWHDSFKYMNFTPNNKTIFFRDKLLQLKMYETHT